MNDAPSQWPGCSIFQERFHSDASAENASDAGVRNYSVAGWLRMIFANWWWSVDRVILCTTLSLLIIGIVLSFAAGPASAERIARINDSFYFVKRHLLFVGPALFVLLATSLMTPVMARRCGIIVFAGMFLLVGLTLMIGPEIKGAQRWIDLGLFNLQPSEFIKPGFAVTASWLLAIGARQPQFPGGGIAMGFYIALTVMLLMQPDYGQWILLTSVWGLMFFVAGWSWFWIFAVGGSGLVALGAGYLYAPHVASRINRFLSPATSDTYQTDKASEALAGGGVFGHDFAGSADSVKHKIPDSHTDFIFAVAGEEFGFVLCALILVLYALLLFRAFVLATRQHSIFLQCAICGLASIIGLQALINIGVNLQLLPTKGMTLPFISYGGSSLVASALSVGFLLSLTRKRPTGEYDRQVML